MARVRRMKSDSSASPDPSKHKHTSSLFRDSLTIFLKLFIAFSLCVGIVSAFSALMRGKLVEPTRPSDEEVARVDALRKVALDEDPPTVNRIVGETIEYGVYTEGDEPDWWPKQQAPVLDALVQKGELPPLLNRVGVSVDGDVLSEPLVMDGAEGIGKYGGIWYRLTPNSGDLHITGWRLAGDGLMRWNVQGDRVVPHLAKQITKEDGGKAYTIHLRKGSRWSDGQTVHCRRLLVLL